MKFNRTFLVILSFVFVSCAPATPAMTFTPEATLTPAATQTATPIPPPTATLSPEELITEMVDQAKSTGELPAGLNEEQMIAFVNELENQRKAAPIYENDPKDNDVIRLYVENPALMTPFANEILSQDNENWYRVNRDFLNKHPDLAKTITPYLWIPILHETDVNGKETGNLKYYDRNEGIWRIIPNSAAIADNWQEPLNTIAEIEAAEENGAFAEPLGKNADLVRSVIEKYGGKSGYLPVVLLDPEKVMRLTFDPNGDTGYLMVDIVPTMVIRHDERTNTSIGLRFGVTGILWDILEGGTSKESPLNTEDFFKTSKLEKLLIKEGTVYYISMPTDYSSLGTLPTDHISGIVDINDLNNIVFGNDMAIEGFPVSVGIGQRKLIATPKE